MQIDPLLAALEQELRADFHKALAGLLATARTRLEGALAKVARERAWGLSEVATQRAELRREIEAMQIQWPVRARCLQRRQHLRGP
jgi:hypothetical protein